MKIKGINRDYSGLLELYFEGETTPEQERILVRYFRRGRLASGHEKFAPLFEYIGEEKKSARPEFPSQNRIALRMRPVFTWAAVAVLLVSAGGILLLHSRGGDRSYRLTISGEEIRNKQMAVNLAKGKLDYVNGILEKVGENTGKVTGAAAGFTKRIKVLQNISDNINNN